MPETVRVQFRTESESGVEHWAAVGDEDYVEGWDHEVVLDAEQMAEMAWGEKYEVGTTLTDPSTSMARLAYDAYADLDTRPGAVETFPDDDTVGSVGGGRSSTSSPCS